MTSNSPLDAGPLPLVSYWRKVELPDGSYRLVPGRIIAAEEEISSGDAARILGVSRRTIQWYCESGVLVEGKDWRKNPSPGGHLRIKRSSVLRIRLMEE